MPKYWVKNYFSHGSFPEVGQKQKTEKKEEKNPKVGDNNGQATHGARKHAWRTQAAWAKNYFAHGIFPEVGQKQKTEKEKKKKKKKTERW